MSSAPVIQAEIASTLMYTNKLVEECINPCHASYLAEIKTSTESAHREQKLSAIQSQTQTK